MSDVLIHAENVSKKFAKNFKRSLYYGLKDVFGNLGKKRPNNTDLRKSEFWAVRNVSFQVRRGECLGLIGHNGAGKSTLLKMLNGLINPDEGSITIRGKVGALIELGAGFNPILTGRENIYNNAAVMGFSKAEIDKKFDEIVEFSEVGEFLDMPVQNYSSGMKVRLGFAVAAQMEPDTLLIDEILAVGDVGFRIKCMNRISELLKNCAVIFVSHSMPQVGKICNNAILMDKGMQLISSTNVGNVITKYFERFETEQSNNYGNGSCSLLAISIPNATVENEIYKLKKGDFFSVDFQLHFSQIISRAYCRLVFHDLETKAIAIASSVENDLILTDILPNTQLKFSVALQNFFMHGKYSLTLNIVSLNRINGCDAQGEIILSARNVIKLTSDGYSQIDYCPIELRGEWDYQN